MGLITWHATQEVVELALSYEPHTFMLSFGDPRPFVPAIKEAGCTLICQVQDVEDGRAARAAGADIIVAQGTEAGGHGADRSTLPLVPAMVDGDMLLKRQYLPRIEAAGTLPTAKEGGFAGRPDCRVPGIGDLYLAGDWVGPEGFLVDASMASARRTARLLMDDGSLSQRRTVTDPVLRSGAE